MTRCSFALVVLSLLGCGRAPTVLLEAGRPAAPAAPAALEGDGGTVRGRLIWLGRPPTVAPYRFAATRSLIPTPLANGLVPRVADDGGVADALVQLEGVARARPWDHPPATVEVEADAIRVRQGDAATRFAVVRCGDAVELRAAGQTMTGVRGQGADFFTLMLPPECAARRRVCAAPGLVELSNPLGDSARRAWLVVSPHPYVTRTDAAGRFGLAGVPAGEYRLVCRVPNWRDAGYERDPELLGIHRVTYRPMVERSARVVVTAGGVAEVEWAVGDGDF